MKAGLKKKELAIIFGIIGIYMLATIFLLVAVSKGFIERSPAEIESINKSLIDEQVREVYPALEYAKVYFSENFVEENGHIYLYISDSDNKSLEDLNTNSEAVSYYLLWTAQAKDKSAFDRELKFVEENMQHPNFRYMMWRLNSNGSASEDGGNIATDADLRTIKALLIAEEQWKDDKYTQMIDELAFGLEKVGITKDGYLSPYGGASGENSTWTANEVWLSYSDFSVFRELAERRGEPWESLYVKMRDATIGAQLENGLYNSMLTESRQYGNGIDGGGYSINSMWIMVRNAESSDIALMKSSAKSLEFYKDKFESENELYAMYGSNGDALSPYDSAWAYALVGRAATALGDMEFASKMMDKLLEHQINDKNSPLYGALPEGEGNESRVGQFTMQESIISMQDFVLANSKQSKRMSLESGEPRNKAGK